MAISNTIIEFFQEQSSLFLHPFSLVSLLLLIFTYKWLSPTKKNTPPSPPRLPIIGNLHQFGTHPYRSLRTLSQKYGDIMFLRLGSRPAIVISSAEFASQAFTTHDLAFAGRPDLRVLKRLLGDGKDMFLCSYGEYWKKLKSICVMHLLSTKRVRSFRKVREEEVEVMTKKIRGMSMVNLSEVLVSYSTDIICRVAFGRKFDGVKDGIDFTKILNDLTELLGGYYIGDYVSWLSWIDRINGVDEKVSKVTKAYDDFIEAILKDHSTQGREMIPDEKNEMGMRDLVHVLLDAQRDGGSFCLDNGSIKALIIDIFGAGSDTTYIALEWIMSELIRNPRVMKELQKEVRGIAGDKESVTEDDLENMNYLRAVIKEALRLHPPTPLTAPHLSTEDVKLNGYDIAAGTLILTNLFSCSRHPAYWDEPERFYPERFLNSKIDFKGQDFQFIPFSSGRRLCPGISFATSSIEIAAANLIHQFDWELPNGVNGESLDMTEAPGITVHKKNPLIVVPIPRIC